MNKLILTILLSSLSLNASQTTYKDTFTRYVGGQDIFRLARQKFPNAVWDMPNSCNGLNDQNRALLGEKNPATGEPVYRTPSTSFLNWYLKCVLQWIDQDTKSASSYSRYFGKEAIELISHESYKEVLLNPKSHKWNALSSPIQNSIVKNMVEEWIGPGIIRNEDEFVQKLSSITMQKYADLTVAEAIQKVVFFIATQEEFLSY